MGSLGSRQRLRSALLALLPVARTWISTSQARFGATVEGIYNESVGLNLPESLSIARQQSLGYRWTLPYDPWSNRGLGGSITWAMDRNLCGQMLPLVRDGFWGVSLVSCETLKDTLHRAFDTWALNHRYIKFTDVTDRCEAAGQLTENCTIAELWITPFKSAPIRGKAEVSFSRQTWPLNFPADFRSTNGQGPFLLFGTHRAPRPVAEVQRATLSFQTQGVCWYLDSQSCSAMHPLKGVGDRASQAMAITLWIMWWLVAMGFMFFFIFRGMKKTLRERLVGNKSVSMPESSFIQGFLALVLVVSQLSMVGVALRLTLVMFPWPFVSGYLEMCWDCYDFEAAVAQEIGHMLGFGHPDHPMSETIPGFPASGQNSYHAGLAAGIPLNFSTCANPWTDVYPGVPPGFSNSRPSIMEDLTTSNPRSCLTQDDLEALNVLYPDCDGGTTVPICRKPSLNIGTIKVVMAFFVPFWVSLVVAYIVQYAAGRYLEWVARQGLFVEVDEARARIDPSKADEDIADRQTPQGTQSQSVALTVFNG